jgi:Family of unknown function (DUF5906)
MKFFALPNLSSHDVAPCNPSTTMPVVSYPSTKEKFREWCANKATKHCFFSAVEGLTPSLRVSIQNPAHLRHGLVVDYDAKITDDMVALIPKNGAAGLLPTWISTTYSGNRRLVFEFEEPILVDQEELASRFMKLLAKELKLKNLLPGLDETSYKNEQYFELGRDWQVIPGAQPIPTNLLSLLIFKAAAAKTLTLDGPRIPIEAVADEVERQFPGRWSGEFVVGARGPLFWIDDGIDRVGCQVGDFGMICYSDRAGKSFLHWGEILGHKFVREFEASRIGTAAEDTWFDGKLYWRKGEKGRWSGRTKEDQIMWLKGKGISARIGPKQTASDAEKVLLAIQEARTVDAAVSIALDSRELVVEHGCRFLNVSVKKAMRPAQTGSPEDFPWLHKFFEHTLDTVQRDHFFAWWKRFYRSGLNGTLEQGQAIIIAGEAGRGKTLVSRKMVGSSVGGFADASRYLMGDSRFNKECGENALWVVDDSKSSATRAQHRAFTEAIKSQISNPQSPTEAKFRDSLTLSWKGRIIITTNVDPDSLAIIPDLGPTIRDKIMLFRFNDEFEPDFMPNQELEATIAKELPFFLAWLLKWHEPDYVKSKEPRYGVKSYHAPALEKAAIMASPAHGLTEALDILRKQYSKNGEIQKKPEEIKASATEMLLHLHNVEGLRSVLKYYSDNTIGRALQTVIRQGYKPLSSKDTKRGTLYTLRLNGEYEQ